MGSGSVVGGRALGVAKRRGTVLLGMSGEAGTFHGDLECYAEQKTLKSLPKVGSETGTGNTCSESCGHDHSCGLGDCVDSGSDYDGGGVECGGDDK